MKRKLSDIPDTPMTFRTVRYKVRYILKDSKTGEVIFIGNKKDCSEYLGITRRKFASLKNKGWIKRGNEKIHIDKVQFKEKVTLEGEERRKAERNAEYAKQYRNRKKRSRFGSDERERISKTKG